MLHTSATLNTNRVGLKHAIVAASMRQPRHYEKVANMMTTTQGFERLQQTTGFGLPTPVAEGANIPFDRRFRLYAKDYAPLMFGQAVGVTKVAEYTNQYKNTESSLSRDGARLGAMMEYAIDQSFWNLFNNGFTSTDTMDGVALFSTAHPTNGVGPTWSNTGATNLALNSINLRTAIEAVASLRDPRGVPMILNLDFHLVVPPGLMFEAQELQVSQKDPMTADNREVTYRNMISPFMVQFLSNTVNWFLVPRDKEAHGLGILWRMPLTIESDYDPENQTTKYFVSREWVPYIERAYGVWGAQGV